MMDVTMTRLNSMTIRKKIEWICLALSVFKPKKRFFWLEYDEVILLIRPDECRRLTIDKGLQAPSRAE